MTDEARDEVETRLDADTLDPHVAVRASRISLAEYLEQLAPGDWDRPSLCDGWTVTDVVAHLSLSTTETWWDFLGGMVRHRGNFDRANEARAKLQAEQHTPRELVAILQAEADSRAHGPGSSTLDQLVDLLVHGQDIARAIDSPLAVPSGPALVALQHVLGSRWYGARKRFVGVSLTATDTDWSTGTGQEIRGPVSSLLLLATGRTAGLYELDGPGVPVVRGRLAAP